MSLLQSFSQSRLPGFVQPPEKTITTMISNLFFSGDRVVKIYKQQKYFFADLKNLSPRRNFYRDDFLWNHQMSPSIYHRLQGMQLQQGTWRPANLTTAQDFCLVMKRIDDSRNLTARLLAGQVTAQQLAQLANLMIANLQQLSRKNQAALRQLRAQWKWPDFVNVNLADNRDWAYSASPYLPRPMINRIIARVKRARQIIPYFQQLTMADMIYSIDSQSDNLLLLDHQIQFLDIMPPKPNWRLSDLLYTLSRPAADVAVLMDQKSSRVIYQTYAQHHPLPSPAVIAVYETISALIRTAYLYNLNQPKLAKRYLDYINSLLPQLP